MSAQFTIRELMTDSALFGDQFGIESWAAWLALLCGFYGLALNRKERRTFEALTGRSGTPQQACEELWLVIGRRGGKSQIAALLAVLEACCNNHQSKLSPGEVATVMVLAADRKQARTVMRYVSGLLNSNPMFKRMIFKEGRDSIELTNRCVIEVGTASFRSVRGYTLACVIADEIAFWRSDESANPDIEILNALRPALATLGGKLIALSSPYRKTGALWNTYKRHYSTDSAILVAQAESRTMNPTLPEKVVKAALELDQAAASAEYLAQFRNDLETFINREVVENAVRPGHLELPYSSEHKYYGFVDLAGGGADEYCVAIGHKEKGRAIVDCIRALKGKPAAITREYSKLLKSYKVRRIVGDRYAGSWPRDEFEKHGITYKPSKKPKSDLYVDLLPALNSGSVELPPCDRLINQLSGLERRTSRAGRDSIDHPQGGHDDRANAIAGVVEIILLQKKSPTFANIGFGFIPAPRENHNQGNPRTNAIAQAAFDETRSISTRQSRSSEMPFTFYNQDRGRKL